MQYAPSTASGRACQNDLGCYCVAKTLTKLSPEDPGPSDGKNPKKPLQFQAPDKYNGPYGGSGGTVGKDLGRFSLGIGGSSGGGGGYAYQQHRQLAPGTKEPYWLYGPQSSTQLYFLAALGGFAGIGRLNGKKGGISKREFRANTCPPKSLLGENANGGTQYYDPKFNALLTPVDEKSMMMAIFHCQYHHYSSKADQEVVFQMIEKTCFPHCSANRDRGIISDFFVLCDLSKYIYGSGEVYINPRCQDIACSWVENLDGATYASHLKQGGTGGRT
ncbi:hypothetical protein AA313_de0209934 [Arthrobotrys entomopaga]|nr:hypothetical protein AA313_de0209934 [Arthrobotrys entomopaga]